MTKLVAHLRAKDTSIRYIGPGIHITHIPNKRKHPLLCYTEPQAMPSLSVLFRVSKEENEPSILICEVPSHTRFIKQVQTPFPFPKLVQMSNEDVHTVILVLGLTKRNRSQGIHTHTTITNFWALPEPDWLLQLPKTKSFAGHSIKKHKADYGHSHSGND